MWCQFELTFIQLFSKPKGEQWLLKIVQISKEGTKVTLVAMVSAGMPKITDDVSRAISQMRLV